MTFSSPGLSAALLLLLTAGPVAAEHHAHSLSERVEATHGGEAWDRQAALEVYITVDFGGQRLITGKMLTDTPVGKTRFELTDGTTLVFDGESAWKAPADSTFQGTRFHVLTWPYFLAAAMKLDDPGTHLEDLGEMPYRGGRKLPASRLTFGDGVGDSPDDWYIVYTHPKSHRLEAMAYIVTFGKDEEAAAAAEPSAIVYSEYVDVDGVQIPTQWQFFKWDAEKGVMGEEIGKVAVIQPRFVDPAADAFAAPEGAEEAPAP
ncbi:MAG: hypothetical protein AAFX50_06005 [Acidobacteriota bacterium]